MSDRVPYLHIFANNLKFLRKIYNLTQEQLAKQLNVAQVSISRLERKLDVPSLEKIFNISVIFKISIDDLLKKTLSNANILESVENTDEILTDYLKKDYFFEKGITLERLTNNKYYCYYFCSDISDEIKNKTICKGFIETKGLEHSDFIRIEAKFEKHSYLGKVYIHHEYLFFIIENRFRGEMGLLIFPFPYKSSSQKYIGGLGGVLSISTGINTIPCFQHILISSTEIDEANIKENLEYFFLQTEKENIRAFLNKESDESVYRMIKSLLSSH